MKIEVKAAQLLHVFTHVGDIIKNAVYTNNQEEFDKIYAELDEEENMQRELLDKYGRSAIFNCLLADLKDAKDKYFREEFLYLFDNDHALLQTFFDIIELAESSKYLSGTVIIESDLEKRTLKEVIVHYESVKSSESYKTIFWTP